MLIILFLISIKWANSVNRVYGVAEQEEMAGLLQNNQETPMFGEYLRMSRKFVSRSQLMSFLLKKKIKRKEYNAPVDFANDVELVFSNALEFNQEHSELWEDAIALRVCLCFSQFSSLLTTDHLLGLFPAAYV